jgi:hypothetical protein
VIVKLRKVLAGTVLGAVASAPIVFLFLVAGWAGALVFLGIMGLIFATGLAMVWALHVLAEE